MSYDLLLFKPIPTLSDSNCSNVKQCRGADRLVRAMDKAGIKTVFSLSGNQIMPVFDAFNDFSIRVIHTRHEAAAVFMAEAYAIVSGEIGVALVAAAPGFGNALGALYTATMSEVPVILLSGDSPVNQDGMGAFQEFDQVAAASPFVKCSLRLSFDDDPAHVFTYAARVAQHGVPGPVHIALPFDVLNTNLNLDSLSQTDFTQSNDELISPAPSASQIENIATSLQSAERPLILAGPHLFRGERRINGERLSAAFDIPVITLESPRGLNDPAKGALPALLLASDCVLYLGKPIDFTSGFGANDVMPTAKVFEVSEYASAKDAQKTDCHDRVIASVQANLTAMVNGLIEHTATKPSKIPVRNNWMNIANTALMHRQLANTTSNTIDSAMYSKEVIDIVADTLSQHPDTILICDGGEFGQWAQAFATSNTRLTNGPAGAIGGSLPYAIGAKLARPNVPVIAIMGDGTAGFHFAEFETAAREALGITVLIGNDSRWNAEHHIQLQNYGEDRALGCQLSKQTRYDLAAIGLGCDGKLVKELSQLPPSLASGFESPRPTCINVIIPGAPAPQYTDFDPAAVV